MWHDILNVCIELFSYQLLWLQGIESQLGELLHNKINNIDELGLHLYHSQDQNSSGIKQNSANNAVMFPCT